LETILKLVHPYAPFVSETIWQTLHPDDDSLLITSFWPEDAKFDTQKAGEFEDIKDTITEIRQIKTLLGYKRGSLYFMDSPYIGENASFIQKMTKLVDVKQVRDGRGLQLSRAKGKCWLDIDRASAKQFVETLTGKKNELNDRINSLSGRLKSPDYTKKAPKNLVDETKDQLAETREELASIDELEKKFSKI
jgi:valyl-tRNA synthetase